MAQQCHQKMQLVFAANSYAGKLPGDHVSSEATEDSAERFSRVDRRDRGPQGRALRMQQRREDVEVRGFQSPRRGNNQRDNQRDNQRENNRDRKRDRKHNKRNRK